MARRGRRYWGPPRPRDEGGAVTPPAVVGAAALLTGEANGFAADFTYATDANRVAVKASSVTTEYAVDSFFSNAGTSPKQVYNVAGTLGWSPHNMCLQSQTFDVAATWVVGTRLTVTANAVAAPDGAVTADRLVETAENSGHQIIGPTITTVVGATYTISVYAKAGERSWLCVQGANETASNFFDLTNGVVGNSVDTCAITAAGGGWYRCSITFVAAAVNRNPTVYIRTANGQTATYLGDVTKGLYLWGAQLNRGSTPLPYLPTTTAARNGLALDYDPVTHAAKGLLCEPAATNLFTKSSEFDVTWSLVSATVGANAIAAPNGGTEADAFIPNSGSVNPSLRQGVTVVAATTYTFSVYVKNGTLGNNWLGLLIISTTTWEAWFNLATGAKGSSTNSPTSYTITSVGNGWYRVDLTIVAGTTSAQCYLYGRGADASTALITGNGTSPAFYAWGAQFETGTVASSPIPTFAASATRAGDQFNCTAASINHSATAGSWWLEFSTTITPTSTRAIAYNNSSFPLYLTSSTVINLFEGTALVKNTSTLSDGVPHKAASAFQSGDRAIAALGLSAATDAGATALLLSPATIFFGHNTGVQSLNGYIRKTYYVPRRMSNAELVTETTP